MADNTEFDDLMRLLSAPDAVSQLLDAPLPNTSLFPPFPNTPDVDFNLSSLQTIPTPDSWSAPEAVLLNHGGLDPGSSELHMIFHTLATLWESSSPTTVVEHCPSPSSSAFSPTGALPHPGLGWALPAAGPQYVCSHYPGGDPDIQRPDHHWKDCTDNPNRIIWNCPIEWCRRKVPLSNKWNLKRHLRQVHGLSESDVEIILPNS